MSVLNVIDRIVGALRFRQIQIEVQMLVAFSRKIKVARGIHAHFIVELLQRHEISAAFTHAHGFTASEQRHQLNERYAQRIRIVTQGTQGRLHPRNVTVMIRAPHIDDAIEAALQLLVMVGDVGGEVSVEPVLSLHDTILIVAEDGGAKPGGAVILVQMTVRAQFVQSARDLALVVERLLRVPAIELNGKARQHTANLRDLFIQGVAHDQLEILTQERLGIGD